MQQVLPLVTCAEMVNETASCAALPPPSPNTATAKQQPLAPFSVRLACVTLLIHGEKEIHKCLGEKKR